MLRQCPARSMGVTIFRKNPALLMHSRFNRQLQAIALVSAMLFAGHAAADEATGHWSVGATTAISDAPYRRYDTDVLVLPSLGYDGEHVYLRGTTVGFRFVRTEASELSITASPLGMRFRSRDSDDPQLRRLKDRDLSGLLGLAWRFKGTWGVVQAAAQKELTGHGGGTITDLSYAYPIPSGTLTLTPRVGVVHTSGALNDYYYGISRRESVRSGLDAYRAGSGNTPYVDLSAAKHWGTRWLGIAGFRYSLLPNAVSDSPMTGKDHVQTVFVSINYML